VRDAAGESLNGRIVKIDGEQIPGDGVSLDDLMMYSYVYQIEYDTLSPLEFITISQHLVDEAQGIPAEMQLRVKQEGSEQPYYGILNGSDPMTVRFNWDKPPLSPSASDEEWDKWLNERREETLGIVSYSSVYSFIYITDSEVRHEILVPLSTLQSSVLIPRRDMAFLELDEQSEAAQQIGDYYRSGNPITIDGQRVEPIVQQIEFYGVDFRDFAQQAPKHRVSMASARAGIILSYPTSKPPQKVQVVWDRFNKHIWTVNSVVYAYDKTTKATFSQQGNLSSYEWKNPGRPALPEIQPVALELSRPASVDVPIASLASLIAAPIFAGVLWICGAGRKVRMAVVGVMVLLAAALWSTGHVTMSDPFPRSLALNSSQAETIFSRLHTNVYRAFNYHGENEIYDALARSVDGPLLQELYLQIQRGLAMQEQGGAVSNITDVKLLSGQPELPVRLDPEQGFTYRCRWTVKGTVEHWGHVHARTNEYEAVFRIAERNNSWKLTAVDLLGEKRIDFETGLRS
jgi:hypothetical protein